MRTGLQLGCSGLLTRFPALSLPLWMNRDETVYFLCENSQQTFKIKVKDEGVMQDGELGSFEISLPELWAIEESW